MSTVRTRHPAAHSHWLPDDVLPGQTPLICLPPSGAGASYYRPWRRFAPHWLAVLPVLLPGRESRISEEAVHTMDAVVEHALPDIEAVAASGRYALFGHSMGALIAYELARELTARGRPPLRLLVSGCPAPPRGPRLRKLSDQPVEEIVATLAALGGTPPEALDHPELIELIEPALRGDLGIVESYSFRPGPLLTCPVTALEGTADPLTTSEEMLAWGEHTTGAFQLRSHPGSHAFPRQRQAAVVHDIALDLTDALHTVKDTGPKDRT